jgi:hypothetical protein
MCPRGADQDPVPPRANPPPLSSRGLQPRGARADTTGAQQVTDTSEPQLRRQGVQEALVVSVSRSRSTCHRSKWWRERSVRVALLTREAQHSVSEWLLPVPSQLTHGRPAQGRCGCALGAALCSPGTKSQLRAGWHVSPAVRWRDRIGRRPERGKLTTCSVVPFSTFTVLAGTRRS